MLSTPVVRGRSRLAESICCFILLSLALARVLFSVLFAGWSFTAMLRARLPGVFFRGIAFLLPGAALAFLGFICRVTLGVVFFCSAEGPLVRAGVFFSLVFFVAGFCLFVRTAGRFFNLVLLTAGCLFGASLLALRCFCCL